MEFVALGGLGEFALHSMLLGAGGRALVVDAGLGLPDESTPGVDHCVPEFGALAGAGVLGYLLTHGHEDHVGALGWALHEAPAPVYGTPMTLALAEPRLSALGVRARAQLRPIEAGQTLALDPFAVTAVAVRHSVPGALGYLVEAEGVRLFLTGDHKGLGGPAPRNVDVLFGDSTGALRAGRSLPESEVAKALADALASVPGEHRVVVALFASNVERVQTLFDLGARHGRTVGLCGRALVDAADAARRLGLLRPAAGTWVPPGRARLVVATGGQGEERAALSQIAAGAHAEVSLQPGDAVFFSGRPILGNERAVARLADTLTARGLRVIDGPELHASGHGAREDLGALVREVAPRWLVPIHGAPRHLHAHAELARTAGAGGAQVVRNGERFAIEGGELRPVGRVPVGRRLVEAGRLVPQAVVRARRAAGRGGVVSIAGGSVTLAGIAGVHPDEIREALRAGGPRAAERLVRRRTGRRPLVLCHD